MSNAKHETIADIVAEMLEFADTDSQSIGRDVLRRRIQHFARRIEAAAKREREAGADAAQICGEIGEMIGREAAGKDSLQVVNAAKMREALRGLLEIVCVDCKSSYEIDGKCVKCPRVVAAGAALSAPPRNCDVGTVAEQAERFAEYCDSEACKRNRCKSRAKALCIERCAIAWSQMPYEEGCAK